MLSALRIRINLTQDSQHWLLVFTYIVTFCLGTCSFLCHVNLGITYIIFATVRFPKQIFYLRERDPVLRRLDVRLMVKKILETDPITTIDRDVALLLCVTFWIFKSSVAETLVQQILVS